MEREFDALAPIIHAWQASRIPVVARLAPPVVRSWRDIPAVPVALFGEHEIFAWPIDKATGVFRSSGTTREARGRHWHRDLSVYRASCLAGARWALEEPAREDQAGRPGWRVRSLMPDNPESSLASMIEALKQDLAPQGGADATTPVLVIGPAFAYVPLIESGVRDPLPAGSVIVETGGFKGRTREVTREELHAGLQAVFGVGTERIIGEYGMCELSSPLWERIGGMEDGNSPVTPARRGFASAPWTRVRILDPETLEDAPRGIVALWDLANWQSSLGLLTADLAHWNTEGRLVIEGRLKGSPRKGCSLAVS